MGNLKRSFYNVLFCLIAFICGSVFYWLSIKSLSEIPRSANAIEQPITVKFSKINQEDKWIEKFKIDAISLHQVDSNRRYVLLIITNRSDVLDNNMPTHSIAFSLKGLTDPDAEIRFSINPSQLKNNQINNTLLLDLGGQLFGKAPVVFTNNLEISSISY